MNYDDACSRITRKVSNRIRKKTNRGSQLKLMKCTGESSRYLGKLPEVPLKGAKYEF